MKRTGMFRAIDELGRVVLPKEIRKSLHLAEKDKLEIMVDGERIILQPIRTKCMICSSQEDVKEIEGITICRACAETMAARYQGEK